MVNVAQKKDPTKSQVVENRLGQVVYELDCIGLYADYSRVKDFLLAPKEDAGLTTMEVFRPSGETEVSKDYEQEKRQAVKDLPRDG